MPLGEVVSEDEREPGRICVGIPHTPWIDARAAAMVEIRKRLPLDVLEHEYREFTDRESNMAWSERMWSWALEMGTPWFVTLQDDVELAPCFWKALHAMLDTLDGIGAGVLGLSSVHPVQVETARQGHRWYRTKSHLVGWAYAIRHDTLRSFMAWRARQALPAETTEDSLLNHWINLSGNDTWHPVPTIVDHDTTLDSTYENGAHVHRRPWITWRDFTEGSLTDRAFWRLNGPPESVPILPTPESHLCWTGCGRKASVAAGCVRLCPPCVAQAAGVLITRVVG